MFLGVGEDIGDATGGEICGGSVRASLIETKCKLSFEVFSELEAGIIEKDAA
jgi:hypothetical protein